MKKEMDYHEQQKIEYIERLRLLLMELPACAQEYFRGANRISSARTKVAYAYDLKIFFHFLCENVSAFEGKKPIDITLSDLDKVLTEDIDRFLEYVSYYENAQSEKRYLNNDRAKARKLSAIRSFYKFFCRNRKLQNNPADIVITPKTKEKNIVRLDVDEVAILLDHIESGEQLTHQQQRFHEHTYKRDFAIVSLLLGTGIRVSECVGIDIADIDFNQNGIRIVRKGGNESTVYFGEEVREALLDYLDERKESNHPPEGALFLSMQKKRINVRTVQKLVKKYANSVTGLKNISPHKLRSTYGTNLYNETGDIYLVADALGHKDVNTTRKHYAKMDDDRRKLAAKYIKLRT